MKTPLVECYALHTKFLTGSIQTPVCIAIGIRHAEEKKNPLARTHYVRIEGSRDEKLAKLKAIKSFEDVLWSDCFIGAQEPFLPQQAGNYFSWPLVTDLFPWQHTGVELKRTWPIAETREVLEARWHALISAPKGARASLFRETPDRLVTAKYKKLNSEDYLQPLNDLPTGSPCPEPSRYSFRSFDRSWVIADNRLASRIRPPLWLVGSNKQIYMTSMLTGVLGAGVAAIATPYVPDRHHLCGRGGKDVMPLWRDADGSQPNLPLLLLESLEVDLNIPVTAEDFFAYTYAVLNAPDYVVTFSEELTIPGPRLPISTDTILFKLAVTLGRRLLWLHTYGERFFGEGDRPVWRPNGIAKSIKAIPNTQDGYPESFQWVEDPATPGHGILQIGAGEIGPVSKAVFEYSVSGYEVVKGWLGSRMKQGSGKKSSPLDHVRPTVWTVELSQELRELLWVLEATVAMQSELNELLKKIVEGPTISAADLPTPTDAERAAPIAEDDDMVQHDWVNADLVSP